MDAITTTEAAIYDALRGVLDPEIGINVVDLGLIYGVEVQGGKVSVTMTLTTPGCPMHRAMGQWVAKAVRGVPGVKDASVKVVWEPRWTPDRLSPAAKKELGFA